MEGTGIIADVRVYNQCIGCCNKSGQWRQALQIFSRMRTRGVEPNTNTYAVLVAVGCKAKAEPPEIYETMKLSSVPEYFAYTAAFGAVHKKRRPWTLERERLVQ